MVIECVHVHRYVVSVHITRCGNRWRYHWKIREKLENDMIFRLLKHSDNLTWNGFMKHSIDLNHICKLWILRVHIDFCFQLDHLFLSSLCTCFSQHLLLFVTIQIVLLSHGQWHAQKYFFLYHLQIDHLNCRNLPHSYMSLFENIWAPIGHSAKP